MWQRPHCHSPPAIRDSPTIILGDARAHDRLPKPHASLHRKQSPRERCTGERAAPPLLQLPTSHPPLAVTLPLHYGTVAVWNVLAAHAPNTKWLQVFCLGNPFSALTRFKALRVLRVEDRIAIPPYFYFGRWPLLERIRLVVMPLTTDLELRHGRLKVLKLVRMFCNDTCILVLDCPFLEELKLDGQFVVRFRNN